MLHHRSSHLCSALSTLSVAVLVYHEPTILVAVYDTLITILYTDTHCHWFICLLSPHSNPMLLRHTSRLMTSIGLGGAGSPLAPCIPPRVCSLSYRAQPNSTRSKRVLPIHFSYGISARTDEHPSAIFELPISQWSSLGVNSMAMYNASDEADKASGASEVSPQTYTGDDDEVTATVELRRSKRPSNLVEFELPSSYINLVAGSSLTACNSVRPQKTFAQAAMIGVAGGRQRRRRRSSSPSLLAADSLLGSGVEAHVADLIHLMRTAPATDSTDDDVDHDGFLILPELHAWQLRGLLEAEPLRVTADKSAVVTDADCELECTDFCEFSDNRSRDLCVCVYVHFG